MKHIHTSRIAALGAAVALGAGALVSVAPAAQAASVKSSYSCATEFGEQVLQVTTKVKLPAKVKKGKRVGSKKVTLRVVLPAGLADGLRLFGITHLSGSAKGATARAGSTRIPVKGVRFNNVPVPPSGPMTIKAVGRTAAFKFKKPGRYTITIPRSFKFSSADQNGNTLTNNAPCSVVKGSPTKLGSIKVTR